MPGTPQNECSSAPGNKGTLPAAFHESRTVPNYNNDSAFCFREIYRSMWSLAHECTTACACGATLLKCVPPQLYRGQEAIAGEDVNANG